MIWFLLSIIASLVVGIVVAAARLRASIHELRSAADRFAQGDLSRRVHVAGPLQLGSLSRSLNEMAAQLEDRLSAVVQQRSETGAVLSSMVEGVVAIDLDDRILSLNRAAARLLRVDPAQAIGRSIQESIRNAPLQAFVSQTLRDSAASQCEFSLRLPDEPRERYVQAQGAVLRNADGRRIGAVIVLHDVTQLRRLEMVRRDFVANVSHEVKTPVSAIKAAVETLLNGDAHDAETTHRFLSMIARQSDRLTAIVEDLLSIARLESDAGEIAAELTSAPLRLVLTGARETCQAAADARDIRLAVECDPQLRARMNAALLEQAVVNLIDNAIKYSPPKTQVQISAADHGDEVVISVADQGRGVEPEHLPRIFERFYRTDKSRSRDMGGTGLGLSIVKHVAETHGGRVTVDSTVGEGSTFYIHLPGEAA